MSKKNSVAKKPAKAATKTLKSAKAASLALDQAVALDAEGQVLLTAAIEEAKTQAQAAAEKADALLAADAVEESKDKEVAEVDSAEVASDKVLSRVEPIDRGGESLLMAAAKGEAQDDDKAAGEWPSFFPLLAGLGALAALGGGGGSGVQHPDGYQGVVFDTPVKNAIVFRDSNGDGIWDATESIAVTDQNGNYTGLSGTGSIVATSLDRLVGRDALGTLTHYKITDSIVINGQTITGFATDVGADETLGTADDFVWSGTYVSAAALQEGSVKVYITAVSSLVTAYLAEKGQTAATPAQVDEAIRELKSIFVYDTSTGMAGAGSDIQFLTSELNGQVTKIMGDAIARAEKDGTDVQQAIKDALTALAKAADKAGAGENIDLTQVEDLQSILFAQDDADVGLVKAEALALQTGKTGPAVYSVWFDEEGTHVTQVEVTQDTLGYDTPVTTGVFSADARPVGNVTVLSNADSSEVGLTVQPKDGQNDFEFQGARLLVRAVGDGSSSGLDVQDATGQVTSVSVQATGGRAYTNETQAIVLNGLDLSTAAAGLEVGTVIDLTIDGEKLSYTVVEGDLTDANVVAKILASFQEQAAAKSIVVRIAIDAEQDQLTFVWADEKSHEPLTVAINELPISLDIVHSEGGLPVDATADLNLNLTGDITDNIEVSASGLNADADARIHGEVDIDGDIDVTASSADAYAEAKLTGTMSLAGDMHVSASAQDAYAAANLNGEDGISTVLTGSDITLAATAAAAQARAILGHVSGQMDQVSVTGQGDDAAAEVDVTAEADKTLTVNTVTLRADSSLSGGSGADADAYFRGETGELGAQRGWEALNAESSDHGTVRITGDIGVTAVGESDWAYLGVNEGGNDQGYTVLAGGDIRLSATGSNASADAFIRNAAGTAGDLEITAGGTSAVQGFDLQNYFRPVGGVVTLAAGDVISFTVGEEEALTYTVTAADARNAQGINALLENVVNSFNTQANDQALGVSFRSTEVDPNSPFSKGLFATWDSVRSEAPAAIKLNGNAINNEAYAFFKDGTVESHAQLDLQTENTGVTAQSLSVTASAQNAVADADILGDVGIEGHMRVTASERFADAQIHINETGHGSTVLGGGPVGVTASGEQSDAQAHVHHASGEVGAISVLASNTLASADLALDTEGQGVTAASLSVLASGQSASADADINGNVSIAGDLGVTASAAVSTAYAHVNNGGDDSTVLGGGDISVTAGGALSDAELHIDNASGTSGAVSVTASSAQADATLNVNTSAELSAESLTVLASAQSADAHANLGGDVAIQGDLSVTASAAEAIAHAHLNDEDDGSTVLGGGDITLTASGALSDAAVYIDNASGTAGAVSLTASSVDADAALNVNISGELSAESLTVLASAQSADADVTVGGDVTLEGDLSVTASATQAIAHAHLNDESDGSTALDGGDLALTASGTSSSAEVYIAHASGTLGEVTLDSTGSDAEAYLEVAAQADKTLTVGSIAIHADSRAVQGSDAWADAYFRGETGKVAEQDRWTELNEVSTDHGTVQLQGDISVSATGQADWVYLGVNDGGYESQNTDRGYTVLAQTGDDENITIQASGTDASAEVYLYNATGTAGNISVTASGSHEVQGFDFLYHFRPVDAEKQLLEVGKVFSVQVGETTYSYEVTFADYRKAASINDLLTKIIAQFNDEAQTLGQGITFSNSYDGQGSSFDKGLFVTWDSVRDETTVSVTYDAKAVLDQDVYFTKDGTVGSTASFDLQTEFTGVTAENLTVTASAENATADTFIHGDVTLNGDIRVTASEVSADAQALINEEGDGQTVLGSEGQSSQLTVTASHDGASAELDVGNVSGFVDSIRVDAGGVDSQAHLHLQESTEEGKTLNITGEMHVVANEVSSDALVSITATQAALDDITVSANSQDAQATLTLDVENTISGDNLHVQADGANARADADLNADLVTLRGDIDVQAAGRKAWANADLDVASVLGTPEHGTHMNVEANGEDSDAVLNIAQASGFVDGINVSSDGYSANAFFDLSDDATQGTVLDIDGAINVQAEGYSASAYANVSATQAHLSDITVSATDGYAHADFMLRTETDLHADHVTALASGDLAGANVALEGTVAITGDVHVSSDGDLARAYVWVNSNDVGTATLGTTVEGVDVGSNITVEANSHGQDGLFFATSSLASISGAQGTVGSLDVSASGDFSTTAVARVEGNITVQGDITVQAKDLENYGAVALNAPLSLVADAANPDGIHFEGSNITVTASGKDSDAEAAIGNASGTLGDISLTADGINADASFDLSIKGELTADSLSVLAGAQSADADADISGDVSITADLSVTASSEDATAHAHINDGGDARTVLGGGDITLSASGTQSGAELHIDNASGSTGAITVTGDGVEAMASFDLSISGDLTADSVTVLADAQSADASVNVNGHVAITGDIDVTGNGQDTNAVVAINAEGGAINEAGGVSTLGQSVEGGDAVGSNIHVDALGEDASAGAYIVGAQGTVGSWDTSASGDGASAQSWILGDITVQGDFSVTADQTEARAYAANAPMFAPFSGEDPSYGSVHFEDSDITVTSKGESSDAYAFIMNATGRIDDIEVTASGQSADAVTWMMVTDDSTIDIHTLSVVSSSNEATAVAWMIESVDISGDITVTASGLSSDAAAIIAGEVNISGDINVTASNVLADAQVGICGDVVIDGNINVLASSQDANADVGIGQNLDFTGNISVDASGTCADAQVHLMGSVDIAGDLSVTASGQSSDALIEISGDVTLSGDINVLASGASADAVIDLDGDIALTGDLHVTARAAGSTAHGTLADQVNVVGDIHITSSGTSAEAGVDMMGSLDIEGNVNVTASGAQADAHFEVSGDLVMVGDIHVTSSGDASMAIAEISNDLTLTGDIHVLSSGEDAMAFGDIRGEANLVGDLLVEATGSAADAYAFLSGDIAMSGDMDVVAASDDSYAEAMFEGSVDITGDMAFTASAESAYTYAEFNNEDSGRTVLDVGSLDITSSGTESSAEVFVDNASGTVDHVHVQATGDSADAYLEIAVEVEKTLTFDTLTVEANSDASTSGDAAIAEAYVFGKTGDIPVQERWKLLDTESTDHGTVEINGDINVTAAGLNDEAYLGVNDSGPNGSASDNGYTLLNGGNVTLAATGTSSDVETYIHNAKGTLADVSVTAGGSHEVQGFDFLHYFRPLAGANFAPGNTFSVTVGDQTVSYTVKENEIRNTKEINALLESIVLSFNQQAHDKNLGVQFASTYTNPRSPFEKGLFATWDSVRLEEDMEVKLADVTIPTGAKDNKDQPYFYTKEGTTDSTAYFELKTENGGVTLETLTVNASAESADAQASINGDVAITGSITVEASEILSDADADIGGASTDTVLGQTSDGAASNDITVTASQTLASADAHLDHVSGRVDDVVVQATGDSADANLDMDIEADKTLSVHTLTVHADSSAVNGSNAVADAYLRGETGKIADQDRWSELDEVSTDHGTVQVLSDISVTAGGQSDWAYLGVNDNGPSNTNTDRGYTVLGQDGQGGDITVHASGTESSAEAYLYNAAGTAGDISVTAGGRHEVQGFDFLYYFRPVAAVNQTLVNGKYFSVEVGGQTYSYKVEDVDDRNTANINALLEKIVAKFNVDAQANQQDITFSSTYSGPGSSFDKGLFVTWDSVRDETEAVIAYGNSSVVNINDVIGGDKDLYFIQNGTVSSDAYLDLHTENTGVTADSLAVTASAQSAVARTDIMGDVAILGDISVTASELSADADVDIHGEDEGTITLGHTVEGEVIGSAIDVMASAADASADALIYNILGTANTLTVSATGVNAQAHADLTGDFVIQSDITVTAENTTALAQLLVNANVCADTGYAVMEGGDITVLASGASAEATAEIHDVSGLAGDLSITASGVEARAALDIDVTAEMTLEMDDVSVLSSSQDATATVIVDGNVDITGDIRVIASALSADAGADINGNGSFTLFAPFGALPEFETVLGDVAQNGDAVGSNIQVLSSGQAAKAEAWIGSGTGAAGNVSVHATGSLLDPEGDDDFISEARLDLELNGTIAGSLDVLASQESAEASATIYGNVVLEDDISVTASGLYAYASAEINQYGEDSTTLAGGDITITASGVSSEADGYIDHASGDAGQVTLAATAEDAYAYLDVWVENSEDLSLSGISLSATSTDADAEMYVYGENQASTVTVTGDIVITGSSQDAIAKLYLIDEDSRTGEVVLGGGDISLSTSGVSSEAHAHIYNASGTLGDLALTNTAASAYTHLELEAAPGHDLTLDNFTVLNQSGADSEVKAEVWTSSADAHVFITGDISVTAQGTDTWALAELNDKEINDSQDVYFNTVNEGTITLGQTTGKGEAVGSNISVLAVGDSSDADAYIYKTNGTAGDVTVRAGGTGEIQYVSPVALWFLGTTGITEDTPLSIIVDGVELSVSGDEDSLDNLNAQALAKNLGVTFSLTDSSDLGGAGSLDYLKVTWSDALAHEPIAFKINDVVYSSDTLPDVTTVPGFENLPWPKDLPIFWRGKSGTDSNAYLDLEINGTIAGDNLIEATGISSDAYSNIAGQVTVEGDVTVVASGTSSDAEADFNWNDTRTTTMVGGDVKVTSSGSMAYADAEIYHTLGSIDALTVEATGVSSEAYVGIEAEADQTLSIGSVTVLADSAAGDVALAEAYLIGESGDIDAQDRWSFLSPEQIDHGTVEIMGDISVSAMGISDEASLTVNAYGEDFAPFIALPTFNGYTVLGGGDISVTAAGTNACADALIANARGHVGDITVSAEGLPEVQGFDFLYYFRGEDGGVRLKSTDVFTCTIAGETLSYTVSSADVSPNRLKHYADEVNPLFLKVVSSFNAQAAEKGLDLSFSSDFEGDSAFDKGLFATWHDVQDHAPGVLSLNGSVIDPVAVNGDSVLINAPYFFNQDGTVDNSAYLDLKTESTGVTADSLTVSASAQGGDAIASITGDVTILDDITVTASELYSTAHASVNGQSMVYKPVEFLGNTVLGGGDISVTASGSPTENQAVDGEYNYFASMATASIGNATGTVGDITVRSSGAPLFSEDINPLSGVSEVQTFNYSFDSDFAAWASSNDSGTTTWTLTVDGQDFTFTGGPADLQTAIVGWNIAASDDGFSFDFSSNELNITWASNDYTDHELASISAEGSVTTGAEWVNVELTTEEQQTFFVDSFLSAEALVTGEDQSRTWTLKIGDDFSYVATSSSDFDFSNDVLQEWIDSAEADGISIEFIDSSDNTQDRFIVSFESNDDIHHSDISFKVANSGDTEDIISGMSDDKAQVFDSTDIGVMVEALGDENLTGDTTWTLHVGGEDYSVDVDASSVNWASADDIRDLIFDVVGSWDTGLSSTSFDIEFVNSTDSSSDYFAITWGSSDSVELASITVDGVDVNGIAQKINFGVIPQFTTQDGVAGTGSNGSAEIQKFYVEDFKSWMNGSGDFNDTWTVTVAGSTFSADVDSYSTDVSVDIADILAQWNAGSEDGSYDVTFALSSDGGGQYFTITVSADDNGTVNISSDDIYANHDLASFDVERTVTRSASWDVKGEDYEMTDGAGNRVICGHEYIPSIAALDLQLDGTISGDIVVEATHVASVAEARIEGNLHLNGNIHLLASGADSAANLSMNQYDDSKDMAFSGDISVSVTGERAEAGLALNGLWGKTAHLDVQAKGQDSVAHVDLVFEADSQDAAQFGAVTTVTIEADHRATALVSLDQSMHNALTLQGEFHQAVSNAGTVAITGEGHVGLTYFVDASTVTAKKIDLSGMNEEMVGTEPSQNLWGYADIDLVAKWVNRDAQGLQTQNGNILIPKMITIKGFNVERDAINLLKENNPSSNDIQTNPYGDNAIEFTHSDDAVVYEMKSTTLVKNLETSTEYRDAMLKLVVDANAFFQSEAVGSSTEKVGYFYREIDFDFYRGSDPKAEEIETRSFLVYDFELNSSGASGIITLGNTTGLTERNVTERYSMTATSSDGEFDGFHNIDLLSASSVFAGSNDLSYDLATSADVMISDMEVTAFETYSADGSILTSGDVHLTITGSDDSSLQLRQSDIFVGADREGSAATLTVSDAWGTVGSLTVHASLGGMAGATIGGINDSTDALFDMGLHVRDVLVTADGDLSFAAVSLDIDGYVDNLSLQALGFGSSVDAVIDQAEYGGVVHVSGSSLTPDHDDCDCVELVGSNDVGLTYLDGTAARIIIDNTDRDGVVYAGEDETVSFNFAYSGEDKDMRNDEAWDTRVTIEGWTSNDSIILSGSAIAPDNFQQYTGQDLFLDEDGLDILLSNAQAAFDQSADVSYYFGNMDGNAYLFHDDDGNGLTMIVEFLGVGNFDYTKLSGNPG